jgi:hypothetical protein
VRLDPRTLQDLAVPFAPKDYVRVTPLVHAATPLGMGYRDTRFASQTGAFKVLYLAENLMTSVAEAVVRDRYQAKARRRLHESEAERWGATSVTATRPLQLIDLRTTGLVRLGVSTEAARGKAQGQGRKLSQAIHDQTDADGILYASRLTAAACVCAFERAVPALQATPVAGLVELPDFIAALQALNVVLEPS